jgi:poly-gamma-glutamate synthesis protein (capsule biosynthesis protein)
MPKDRGFGHALIRAGADGVIGSHTHRVQPFVVFRGKPIFFSLGSFLFPDFYQQPPCPVWYPGPSEDLRDIPVVNRYTCSHRQRVKFVWPQASRIGAIAEVRIGARITAGYRLTYLTDDNKVTFLADTKRYVRMLSCLGLAVRSPFYSSMFLLSECCLYLMRRLARNGERGHRSCLAD